MSSGQLPRWPAFYPQMKVRGRYRRGKLRVLVWTSAWEPIWIDEAFLGDCRTQPWVHVEEDDL